MTKLRYHSVHGKLSEALGDMAASSKPLAKRIEHVFVSYLIGLKPTDFPEPLQAQYSALVDELTRRESEYPDEGRLRATLRKMSPASCKRVIKELSSMQYQIAQAFHS